MHAKFVSLAVESEGALAVRPHQLGSAAQRCHIYPMTDTDPTKLAFDDWIAELEISEAEVARGECVPLSLIIEGLHESAARIAAKRAAAPHPKAARLQ
jgi:hypothetical protein